ncbi:MAG: bifunctional nicotinamidase/pyrazinamidase [Erysipelotrichia bacterium]|nr:bifunctional nicotinamidase/pyrazinamidase [Erysipelotrichia bacterium]
MKALVLVDLQNDFMPGGALAVVDGDAVIPLANWLAAKFPIVVATQDWHPHDHQSFAVNNPGKMVGDVIDLNGCQQTLWPAHCVQEKHGADFHPDLKRELIQMVFKKGINPEVDSYSGFFDNNRKYPTGLETWLREKGVTDVYILGLATDYCVKHTAIDAASLGFNTYLIEDACRGVDLNAGDSARSISAMKDAGVKAISSRELQVAFA